MPAIYTFTFILLFFSACQGKKNPAAEASENTTLPDQTWQIFQDATGNYWFGSNGDGLFRFDGEEIENFTKDDGLASNTIRSLQSDKAGNLFVGTPTGVSKYDGKNFTTLPPVKSASNAWQNLPDDLWFNCNGNAKDVYRYDGETLYQLKLPRQDLYAAFGTDTTGVSFPGMNNSAYAVYGIDRDTAGNMWFGTVTAGAFRFDGESFLWFDEAELSTLPDGRVPGVRSLLQDKNGYFWLSNFVSKYEIIETDSATTYKKLPGIDSPLLEDMLPYYNSGLRTQSGDLYLTTYGGGVWKYDGKELTNTPVKAGETDALLISIYEDKNGTLWLGTDNLGVFRQEGKEFVRFSLSE